jgi:hypothetical protein
VILREKQPELVISISVKLIPKRDDQSDPEQPTRNNRYSLMKDTQTERIAVSLNIRDLNKDAS